MHKARSENDFWYKCLKPNCRSSFRSQSLLDNHNRIHNNELNKCHYCPYRYVRTSGYNDHLNKHFGINDYKCDHCASTFSSKKGLTEHSSLHEGIVYCCLICKKYEIASKNAIKVHLRAKHSDILGKNLNWDSVKKYLKIK